MGVCCRADSSWPLIQICVFPDCNTDQNVNLQTWDAFDFFTVSLTVSDLAETFDKDNTDITWGITLVLMFRCESCCSQSTLPCADHISC